MPAKPYYDPSTRNRVEAIEINPSEKTADIETFCPTLRWNRENGIDFLPDGRRVQHYDELPFFHIGTHDGKLFDWVVKTHKGHYLILKPHLFHGQYTPV